MPGPLSRLSTALADRYRVERELGQGGMAAVYLSCLVNLLILGLAMAIVFLPAAVLGDRWYGVGIVIAVLFPLMVRATRWLIGLVIVVVIFVAVAVALSVAETAFNARLYLALVGLVQLLAGAMLLVHRKWWRGWLYGEILCIGALLASLITHSLTGWYGGAAVAGILSAGICFLLLTRRAGRLRV